MGATTEDAARPVMLLVEELAGDVPERYVMQPNDRPPVDAPVAQIPVINLGVLSQEHAAGGGGEEAARLRSALESWGIFLVTGHGVEPSLMDAMWNASRGFFRQPVEEKKKYTDDLADGEHYEDYHQGYGTKQVQSQGQSSLEWSDRLLLQVEPQDQRKLHLWPESLRDILHEYSVELRCGMLNNTLLPAMERLLGLSDDYLVGHLRGRATTFARMNYYPPCSRPDLVFGIKSHSDATLVSVLMVDDNDIDGLQVLKDDIWYNVPASSHPHTLLIIVGDATEIISNGVFKSPVHRAVTNAKKERASVVMFYGPDIEAEIGPANELIDDNRPSRFKKVMAHEYLTLQYEHLSRGTRALDTMRM